MAEFKINARGLQCPGPIVKLFATYKQCTSGDIMIIEVTEQGFKKDVYAWAKKTNCEIVSLEEQAGVITAVIKKN